MGVALPENWNENANLSWIGPVILTLVCVAWVHFYPKARHLDDAIHLASSVEWRNFPLQIRVQVLKAWSSQSHVDVSPMSKMFKTAFPDPLSPEEMREVVELAVVRDFSLLLSFIKSHWQLSNLSIAIKGSPVALSYPAATAQFACLAVLVDIIVQAWTLEELLAIRCEEDNSLLHLLSLAALHLPHDDFLCYLAKVPDLVWVQNKQNILPIDLLLDMEGLLGHYIPYQVIVFAMLDRMIPQSQSSISENRKLKLDQLKQRVRSIITKHIEGIAKDPSFLAVHGLQFALEFVLRESPSVPTWRDANGFSLLTYAVIHQQPKIAQIIINAPKRDVLVFDNSKSYPLIHAILGYGKAEGTVIFDLVWNATLDHNSTLTAQHIEAAWFHAAASGSYPVLSRLASDQTMLTGLWKDSKVGFHLWYTIALHFYAHTPTASGQKFYPTDMLTPQGFEGVAKALVGGEEEAMLRSLLKSSDRLPIAPDGNNICHYIVCADSATLVEKLLPDMLKLPCAFQYNNAKLAPVHLAIVKGHLSAVLDLYKAQCLSNKGEKTAFSGAALHPFLLAITMKKLDMVRVFLDYQDYKLIEVKNAEGATALHLAIDNDDEHMTKLLLSRGASLSTKSYKDVSPVSLVAILGKNKAHSALLTHVKRNRSKLDKSIVLDLLQSSIIYGTIDMANAIINNGCVDWCDTGIVELFSYLLLRSNLPIDKSEFDSVRESVASISDLVLPLLLEQVRKSTKVHCAVIQLHSSHSVLPKRHFDELFRRIPEEVMLYQCKNSGNTLLHYAFAPDNNVEDRAHAGTCLLHRLNLLQRLSLAKNNAQRLSEIKNDNGYTPLHLFAMCNPLHFESAEYLQLLYQLFSVDSVNIKTNEGFLPIHVALLNPNQPKDNVTIRKRRELLIGFFSILNREDGTDYLNFRLNETEVELQVQMEEAKRKMTSIHIAALSEHVSLATFEILVEHVADVDKADGEGNSAIDYARALKRTAIVELLQSRSKWSISRRLVVTAVILLVPFGLELGFLFLLLLPRHVDIRRLAMGGLSVVFVSGGIALAIAFPPASVVSGILLGAASGCLLGAGLAGLQYAVCTEKVSFREFGKVMLIAGLKGAISGAISGGIGYHVGAYLKANELLLTKAEKISCIVRSQIVSGGTSAFINGYITFGITHNRWGADALGSAAVEGALGALAGGLSGAAGCAVKLHLAQPSVKLQCFEKKLVELGVGVAVAGGVGGGIAYLHHGIKYGDFKSEKALEAAFNGAKGAAINHFITVSMRLAMEEICFVPGTLVHTAEGLRSIESIRKGDLVYSWNERQKCYELQEVRQVFASGSPSHLLQVLVSAGECLTCTAEHPFFVVGAGWTAAKSLQPGDTLQCWASSRCVQVDSISLVQTTACTVHNFEVAGNHNYLVGKEGYLVHNSCTNNFLARHVNPNLREIEASGSRAEIEDATRNNRAIYDGRPAPPINHTLAEVPEVDTSDPQSEKGLWRHILACSAPPEHEELARLVGRSLLATNQTLWEEKDNLQSILYEYGGARQPQPQPTKFSSTKRTGKKLFTDAIHYSQIHYEIDLEYSEDVMRIFQTNKFDAFNMSPTEKEQITVAISSENDLLVENIMVLQMKVEEMMMGGNASKSDLPNASTSRNTGNSSANAAKVSKSQAHHKAGATLKSNPLPSSVPAAVSNLSVPQSPRAEGKNTLTYSHDFLAEDTSPSYNSPGGDEPGGGRIERPPSSSRGGRFRSRLQEAQVEAYMAEDIDV
eukprot:gene23420-28418_t